MIFDENDVHNLALCAWKEARGEGIGGCCLVMHVICNRVGAPAFPKTLHDVIYQKNAFTSMSVPTDPEYNLQPSATDSTWLACLADAPNVLNGDSDPTGGARYYANLATMDKGGWFERNIVGDPVNHPQTIQIGRHTFFK